jgi:hypothetical protein
MSHFKFAYTSLSPRLKNINELVAVALSTGGMFAKRRKDAVSLLEKLEQEDISNNSFENFHMDSRIDIFLEHLEGGFMQSKDAEFRKSANLFLHSLYPPSILYWMRVLGRDKIMVIPSEKLKVAKKGGSNEALAGVLRRVYRFLGLCPFNSVPNHSVHETDVHKIPSENLVLNSTMHDLLVEFFEPYNKILKFVTQGEVNYASENLDR